jgi:hypothetical protein
MTSLRTAEDFDSIPITGDYDDDGHLWLFHFGAYGWTKLYVWTYSHDGIETAFEHAVEWLDDNAPGHLVSFEPEDYKRAAAELGLEWQENWPDYSDEDFCKVAEKTEVDHTPIGHITLNNGTHVASWEWTCDEVEGFEKRAIADRSAPAEPSPYFDRFDVCEAYYLFGSLYHSGQGSKEYAYMGRIANMGVKVRDLSGRSNLTENGRGIYDALVAKAAEKAA